MAIEAFKLPLCFCFRLDLLAETYTAAALNTYSLLVMGFQDQLGLTGLGLMASSPTFSPTKLFGRLPDKLMGVNLEWAVPSYISGCRSALILANTKPKD